MSRCSRVLASFGACALALVSLSLVAGAPALGTTPADHTVATTAADWLATQQQPDGSFELVGFFGFETRDAALAIAEAAQTGSTWSTSEAHDALAALHGSGPGNPSALDALDAYAASIDSPDNPTSPAGSAAKTIALSAMPLGLDPTDFDANGDGTGVDLTAFLSGDDNCDPLTFTDVLYAMIADVTMCGSTPADSIATVRAAQQANGGWNFAGDTSFTVFDPDETGLAIQALVAAGVPGTDAAITAALGFAAHQQQADGGWIDAFASASNAGSTSLMVVGLDAAGYDPASPCWRNTVAPDLAATAYASPMAWLRSQQQPDGHIRSPYDGQGFDNTLTTSQTVHALLANWLPITRAAAQNCVVPGPAPAVSTTTPAPGDPITVSGGGYQAGAELTIQLFSTPVLLGTTHADGTGAYAAVVTIPADTAAGEHHIVVSGLAPDGQVLESTVTITVSATSTAAPTPVVTSVRLTG